MEEREHALVIFGAGASNDLGPDVYAVPLAGELFKPEYGHYLGGFDPAPILMPELRRRIVKESVEDVLGDIERRAEGYDILFRALLGVRYYLAELVHQEGDRVWSTLDTVTNLTDLVIRIDEWRHDRGALVSYVTFNYDTLLERACAPFLPVREIDDYVTSPDPENSASSVPYDTSIYKVHGSANWGREITPDPKEPHRPIYRRDLLERPKDYLPRVTGRIRVLDNPISRMDGEPYWPAIAIPTATNSVYVCPDSHRDHLHAALESVTRVLIVGWKAHEAYFLNDLDRLLPKNVAISIVGRQEEHTKEVAERLRPLGLRGAPDLHWNGFSGFMSKDGLGGFLARNRPSPPRVMRQ